MSYYMKTELSLCVWTSGSCEGHLLLQCRTGEMFSIHDLDGDQISDIGRGEWKTIKVLGHFDADDNDAFQTLIANFAEASSVEINADDVTMDGIDDGYLGYTIDLEIADKTYYLGGWMLVGWLKPGAHADLDGSGLALWGDAQPGGWTSCESDGCSRGRPEVLIDLEDSNHPINIHNSDVLVECEQIPQWNALVEILMEIEEAHDSEDNDVLRKSFSQSYDLLDAAISEWRMLLAKRIQEAINVAVDAVEDGEPDNEDVYDCLSEVDGLEALPIRMGDYLGCGQALAWKVDGTYSMTYWPDKDDISRALKECWDDIVVTIYAELPKEACYENV